MAGAAGDAVVVVPAEDGDVVAAEAAGASQPPSPLRRPVRLLPMMKIRRPEMWMM